MMKKTDFVNALSELDIPINEGQSSVNNASKYPRIVFWEIAWDDKLASDDVYITVETIQVSFFSRTPRHDKLLELRDIMRKLGLHPTIYHEYVEEKNKDRNYYHSYFTVELEVDNDE